MKTRANGANAEFRCKEFLARLSLLGIGFLTVVTVSSAGVSFFVGGN